MNPDGPSVEMTPEMQGCMDSLRRLAALIGFYRSCLQAENIPEPLVGELVFNWHDLYCEQAFGDEG